MRAEIVWTVISMVGVTTAWAEQYQKAVAAGSTPLPAVAVTVTPLTEDTNEIAQPIVVLSGESLERKKGLTLGDTLAHELGVSSSAFGVGAARPILRGLGGARVRVLEGGVGTADVSDLSPDHAVGLDPLFVDQVEILKGPATLLYGNSASGGVINAVSQRIPDRLYTKPRAELIYRFDSATAERSGGGRYEGSLGNFSVHLDGVKRGTDDYEIPGFGAVVPQAGERRGKLFNSDLDTENLNGGVSYVGDFGYAGVSVGHLASNYGIPGAGTEAGGRIDLRSTRIDFAGTLDQPLVGLERVKLRTGYTDYRHFEIEGGGEIGTRFRNNEFEGRLEALHQPVAGWRGVFGVQGRSRDFAAVGAEALTPPVVANGIGIFLVEERKWRVVHLDLGARFDNNTYDASPGLRDRHFDSYSLAAGITWDFIPGYALGVSATRSQRAPNIDELYNQGPHFATRTFEFGDANLALENSNNLDLSLRKNAGRWTWRANGFVNLIDNYVFARNLDQNGDGVADRVDEEGNLVDDSSELQLIRYEQQDAVFYGGEFETGYALLRSGPYGRLNGRLYLDFVRAKLQNQQNVPRIPPLRYGAGLDYRFGGWSATADLTRADPQDDTALLETTTDGYTLLNLGFSYTRKFKPAQVTFALEGKNLFNEEVRVATSFLKDIAPLPGRSVGINLRTRF